MPPRPSIAPARCISAITDASPSLSIHCRSFSTTPSRARQTPSHLTVPKDQVPDYPYGRFWTYKQRNEGLFGRTKIRFGNVVAPKYGNKSRTTWLPNRHTKRLWSPSLNAFIRTRMTAGILHTIDHLGGIDEYLLGSKAKRIKELGPAGWALRWKIMQTDAVKARFAAQRAALGLPPKETSKPDPAPALPAELAAKGLSANDVLNEVDAMLARDDEFVIGDPAAEAGESLAPPVALEGREGRDAPRQEKRTE
ncbi:hypothetical protein GGR50DRAFT_665148 [Xylaria sp. CBS 124048]|nr:hypothetical protein GGR50DRAFT_665148 [Xylaria sp. CBS 124048]